MFGVIIAFFVLTIIGCIFTPADVNATSLENITMSANIKPSAGISLSTSNINLDILPSVNGSFGKSDALEVSVYTNTLNECTVTMIADSSDLSYTSGGTTYTIDSLASGSTYTDATFTNDKWGYQVGTSNYRPVATSGNPITSLVGVNTGNSSTVTADVYFAAKLTLATEPGTYTNTVNFATTCSLIPPSYTVTIATSNADGITIDGITYSNGDTPSIDIGSHTISGTYPSGYEFDSWSSTGSIAITSTSSATTTINVTGAGTLALTGKSSCQSTVSGTMQNFNPSNICSNATGTLTDSRDGKTYTVAKLADGNWWMTSNLNLAGGTKLDSAGSDVPAGYTQSSPYYTLPTSETISSGTTLTNSSAFSNNATAYVFNTGNNTTTCDSSTPCNSYYSWLAATAGGKDSSGNAVETNGYNAAYSICPKGWRLPTATTSNAPATTSPNWKTGDWYALATAYGANLESNIYANTVTFYNNAGPGTTPNFLFAGCYVSGSFYDGGSRGLYWSATAGSSTGAYSMDLYSGSVTSAANGQRRSGMSVRCMFGD